MNASGAALPPPLAEDRRLVLERTRPLWESLRGRRLLLVGGTGFVGCWLLETLLAAQDALDLGAEVVILSRHPAGFAARAPHLAGHPAVHVVAGHPAAAELPPGPFALAIHAPACAPGAGAVPPAGAMVRDLLVATRRVLAHCGVTGVERLLLVSTGAVYRPVPAAEAVGETHPLVGVSAGPEPTYPQVRREVEDLCRDAAAAQGFALAIARGFSFLGPHLPLDRRFAVGDFLQDAAAARPVRVAGSGRAVRSYLYAADLAEWLWTILLRGRAGAAYNVGGSRPVTIADLARVAGQAAQPPQPVVVAGEAAPGAAPDHYLPDTTLARREFGLAETVTLSAAVARTLAWLRARTAT